MSLRNRFIVPAILSALPVLAVCGSGNSVNHPTPPPSGAFSNSNFNGTYTFSVAGANGAGIFALAGGLVGCGCIQGTISSAFVDVNDPTGPAVAATIGNNRTSNI